MSELFKAICILAVLMLIIGMPLTLVYNHYNGYDATLKKYEQLDLQYEEFRNQTDYPLRKIDMNKCIYDNLKNMDEDVWLKLKHPEESIIRKCAGLGARESDPLIMPMPIIPSR